VPANIAVVLTCAKLAELRYAISFTSKYYKPDLWAKNRARKAKLFLALSPFIVMKERVKSLRQCSTNLAQLSTMFILPIKQNGGAAEKNDFLNLALCFSSYFINCCGTI